ncbi:hypothetical protein DFH07DRAFT_763754 [Mycena maculata]|uniref:Uncharacterized protein n=1 Tax=Mycena maculata TaxID=230809 RepID=A0AAD7P2R2_9AGAR|nr:hypothetical protein DFH07DRAFT_763754 [Mycena maculata]
MIESNLDEDDGARFIFMGKAPKFPMFAGMYMQSGDLKKRLQGACVARYVSDNIKKLPFQLWSSGGTMGVDPLTFEYFRIQNPLPANRRADSHTPVANDQMNEENNEGVDSKERLVHRSKWVFANYCDLARDAARAPADPWAVTARFWDHKTPPVTLILRCSGVITKEVLEQCCKNVCEKETPTRFQPVKCDIRDWDDDTFKNPGFVCIGGHPHQIYETWVSAAHLATMDLRPGHPELDKLNWPTPTKEEIEAANEIVTGVSENEDPSETTKTLITEFKVAVAARHPRVRSQLQVMGASAADVAQKLGWDEPTGKAEWLHRSAYSYGGLGGESARPWTSQKTGNLIFGTKETNTMMLRTEMFLKRLTLRGNVRVKTELIPFDVTEKKYVWLAQKLKYTYKADTTDARVKNVREYPFLFVVWAEIEPGGPEGRVPALRACPANKVRGIVG